MDVVINNMAYFWAVVALFFLVMEMGSPGLFFFLAFFIGGIVAAITTFFCSSLVLQTLSFFVATGSALLLLHYYIIPLVGKDRPHERTNVYALQGKRGFVMQDISIRTLGMVKINGQMWGARSINGEVIVQGELVEVVDTKGTHVIVKKCN